MVVDDRNINRDFRRWSYRGITYSLIQKMLMKKRRLHPQSKVGRGTWKIDDTSLKCNALNLKTSMVDEYRRGLGVERWSTDCGRTLWATIDLYYSEQAQYTGKDAIRRFARYYRVLYAELVRRRA